MEGSAVSLLRIRSGLHLVPVELRQLVLAVELEHDALTGVPAGCAVQQARLAAVQLLLQVVVVETPGIRSAVLSPIRLSDAWNAACIT